MKNAKCFLMLLSVLFLLPYSGNCQVKLEANSSLSSYIIELDKAGWEAWKNKQADWFEQNTTTDFISISAEEVSTKSEVIKATVSACEIKSYVLSEITCTLLAQNSVLLSYICTQEGSCGNAKIPSKIRVAANYIQQNEKWLEAFYMEAKID
ncbi:MAG: nuclear transport factor 2 family protein [Bacteroidetes bacterium]|nr:nuclear transport factor 2 family protein [Bacteroidota bacterium]